MYKYILETAGNINWMALFSLITFLSVFLLAIVLVFRRSDEHIRHMASLPLDDDSVREDQTDKK
jgi:cbb3-type cytochrome oxidase subunit 3